MRKTILLVILLLILIVISIQEYSQILITRHRSLSNYRNKAQLVELSAVERETKIIPYGILSKEKDTIATIKKEGNATFVVLYAIQDGTSKKILVNSNRELYDAKILDWLDSDQFILVFESAQYYGGGQIHQINIHSGDIVTTLPALIDEIDWITEHTFVYLQPTEECIQSLASCSFADFDIYYFNLKDNNSYHYSSINNSSSDKYIIEVELIGSEINIIFKEILGSTKFSIYKVQDNNLVNTQPDQSTFFKLHAAAGSINSNFWPTNYIQNHQDETFTTTFVDQYGGVYDYRVNLETSEMTIISESIIR